MRKKIMFLLAFMTFSIIMITSVYASNIINITLDGTYNFDASNEVVNLVNIERRKLGLNNLTIDYNLTKTAQLRAKEASLYFSHTRSNGNNLNSLNIIGENLAAGATTAIDVMEDWMNSSGHKSNILNKNYKSIGVASFKTRNGTTYWVQVFNNNKNTNTKLFTGNKIVEKENVDLKVSFIKNIKVYDLQYKKIKIGESYTISKASIQNAGWERAYTIINNSNFKFTSSDNNIATIDSNGTIKGISSGKVIITITLANNTASYEIQIGEEKIEVENLSFINKEYSMYTGSTIPYNVTILPNNASSKITWISSNEEVAAVDNKGNVTAIKEGNVIITAISSNGKKASFKLFVKEKEIIHEKKYNEIEDYKNIEKEVLIEEVNLNCNDINLQVGELFTPIIDVFPKNHTEDIRPSWIGFDYRIAEVSSNGIITGKSAGSSYVKVVVGKNNVEATCKVNVIAQSEVEKLDFSYVPTRLKINEVRMMKVNIYPESATDNTNITWSSSDESVATITQNGTLFTNSSGEVIISVTANNGVNTSIKLIVE